MNHLSAFTASLAILGISVGCAAAAPAQPTVTPHPNPNIHQRSALGNCRVQFERNKTGHVAFIGGSITQMNGYRPMVSAMLTKRFPDTKFTFTDAGISSTCSTTGAGRLVSDVLSKGPVDLFFIEFAVNDDQDAGHKLRECIRGMEGIIRHGRTYNPNMDIIITYFVNPGMIETIDAGKNPIPMTGHKKVAEHYSISTIDLLHRFSRGLHYPRTVMFDADLKPGKHTLKLKTITVEGRKQGGLAARIMQFVAN